MNDSIREDYMRLKSLEKLTLIITGIVIILFIAVRFNENAPLWLMLAAVVCALFDGMLVIGYAHNKEELARKMKERKKTDE